MRGTGGKIAPSRPILRQTNFDSGDGLSDRIPAGTGFTLVEMLVALILLGLVFLLLLSALQFATKAWNSSEESHTSRVVAVQSLIRNLISEARPVMIEADESTPRHAMFIGGPTSLSFVAPMPPYLGLGGFYEVTIALSEGNEVGGQVEMSWHAFRRTGPFSSDPLAEKHVTLLEGVTELNLAYFGKPHPGQPAQWYDSWRNVQVLPELVRIRVKLVGKDDVWPELEVAPKVQSLMLEIEPDL